MVNSDECNCLPWRYTRWNSPGVRKRACFVNRQETWATGRSTSVTSGAAAASEAVVFHRQTLAPFCPTPLEDVAPTLGLHALPKAMRFGPFPVIRLICALHPNHFLSLKIRPSAVATRTTMKVGKRNGFGRQASSGGLCRPPPFAPGSDDGRPRLSAVALSQWMAFRRPVAAVAAARPRRASTRNG